MGILSDYMQGLQHGRRDKNKPDWADLTGRNVHYKDGYADGYLRGK